MTIESAAADTRALLEVGLPTLVWRHCRDGAATVALLEASSWHKHFLNVKRARHAVRPGLYRLQIEGPWYRLEKTLTLAPLARNRVRITARDFEHLPVSTIALSRRYAQRQPGGTFWIRALTATGNPAYGAEMSIDDAASLRVTIAGRLPKLMLVAVVPGGEAYTYALPMRHEKSRNRSVGRLILRRHGQVLIMSCDAGSRYARMIASCLDAGDAESAGRSAEARLRTANRDRPRGVEGALVAAGLLASGRFDQLPGWIGESLDDPLAGSDFHAAMAEWYARAGCHLAALNLLLRIPLLGKPVLARSYVGAMTLLRTYAAQGPVSSEAYAMASRSGSSHLARLVHGLEREPRLIEHIRGQELERWNREEARRAAAELARGVVAVDRDQLFLSFRMRENPPYGKDQRSLVSDQMRFAFETGWKRFEWRVPHTSISAKHLSAESHPTKSQGE